MTIKSSQAGFTLVELLLSLAVITVVAGLTLPVYASFQTRNELDLTAQKIASQLRRAQTYSRAVSGDSQWGVAVQSGAATLYKGASYATRDTTYDETVSIPGTIALSGVSDVPFAELTGYPTTTGAIILTLDADDIRTVSINAKGMVSY